MLSSGLGLSGGTAKSKRFCFLRKRVKKKQKIFASAEREGRLMTPPHQQPGHWQQLEEKL